MYIEKHAHLVLSVPIESYICLLPNVHFSNTWGSDILLHQTIKMSSVILYPIIGHTYTKGTQSAHSTCAIFTNYEFFDVLSVGYSDLQVYPDIATQYLIVVISQM